MGKLTHLSL